jgi:hypothetical protein
MTNIKPWWQSKTMWGAIMTIASATLGVLGYDIGDAEREAMTGVLTSLGAAIGGLVAIIGRIKARNRIG